MRERPITVEGKLSHYRYYGFRHHKRNTRLIVTDHSLIWSIVYRTPAKIAATNRYSHIHWIKRLSLLRQSFPSVWTSAGPDSDTQLKQEWLSTSEISLSTLEFSLWRYFDQDDCIDLISRAYGPQMFISQELRPTLWVSNFENYCGPGCPVRPKGHVRCLSRIWM